MARYFVDVDGYGDVALWAADGPDDPKPQPVIYRNNVRHDHRDHLWPVIVAAVTSHRCEITDTDIDAALADSLDRLHRKD